METELLTVVDSQDVVLGYSDREDILRRALSYRCVQVFIFDSEGKIFLFKRPETKKRFASQFAGVMGYVRKGELYEDAAYRQVMEELGVRVKLSRITKFSVLDGRVRVFQEVFEGRVAGDVMPDKTEISDIKKISFGELKSEIVLNASKYAHPFSEAVRAYMKAKNVY